MIRASRVAKPLRGNLRLFSNNPSPYAAPTKPVKPLTPNPSKPPSGGGFAWLLLLTGAGVGAISYYAEKGQPQAKYIAEEPGFSAVFTPIRGLLRDFGVVPPTPVPSVQEAPSLKDKPTVTKELPPLKTTLPDKETLPPAAPEYEPRSEPTPSDNFDAGVEAAPAAEETAVVAESILSEELVPHAAVLEEPVVAPEVVEELQEPAIFVEVLPEEVELVAPTQEGSKTASILPEVDLEALYKQHRHSHNLAEVMKEVAKQAVLFRRELESSLLKDIDSMDAAQLRTRITELVAELFERHSWENLRLGVIVDEMEADFSQRYDKLLRIQREQLEFEVQKILFEKEKELAQSSVTQMENLEAKYREQLHEALRSQAEGFQSTLQKELEANGQRIQEELQSQLNSRVAMLRKSHNDHLLELQPMLSEVSANLEAFNATVESAGQMVQQCLADHALSAAVLSLESLLSEPMNTRKQPLLKEQVAKLRAMCREDALVVSVMDALPENVIREGALTLPELQVRFQVMREEMRKAALAPENAPKMVGQLVGSVLASISFAPNGYIRGPGTEEALARAAFCLERGNLRACLHELEGIQGYSRVLMQDWQKLATDRVVVDQALNVLRANAILRHRSLA